MIKLLVRVALTGIFIALIVTIFSGRKEGAEVMDTTFSIMKWIVIVGVGLSLLIGFFLSKNKSE